MKYISFITLLILASATLGSAQIDFANASTSISQGCQDTLLKVLGDQNVNACFPFSKVTQLLTGGAAALNPTSLATAADAICADPPCSSDLVTKTRTTVQDGCKSDISSNVAIVGLINFVLTLYSPTRDSTCFKNSTGGYCFIESEMAGQQLFQSAPAGQNPVITLAGAPAATVCTPCNKAIANSYANYINANPNVLTQTQQLTNQTFSSAKAGLSSKCGQSFLDGTVGDSKQDPKTFQSQSTTNKKSDAASLIVSHMSLVVLLVGTILAIL